PSPVGDASDTSTHRRVRSLRALESQIRLLQPPLQVVLLDGRAHQPDMAVGPQEKVGRTADRHRRQRGIVLWIRGHGVHLQHVAEPKTVERRRRLPDYEQVETRDIEPLEEILALPLRW